MAATQSVMIELGMQAPSFELPAANPAVDEKGETKRRLADYDDAEALVVVFTCNHCPYAKHVEDRLIEVAEAYTSRGVQVLAISSNDADKYPDDSFDAMKQRAREKDYPFPYLYDESQEVARAYSAACTPDFYVFDGDRKLVYRGRFDETRPGQGRPTGEDLRGALDELLESGQVSRAQYPSIGCNIKWKPGNAPS
ncbi:MAG: thioredoxin family protein [Rhodothermales bacterium]